MSYYAVDREAELWDNSEAKSEVWVQDTGESGFEPQLTATFTNYGDAVMFAHMKNREPEIKGTFTYNDNDTDSACAEVVETGEIIAKFSDDDQLMNWLLRDFPLYAATHRFQLCDLLKGKCSFELFDVI